MNLQNVQEALSAGATMHAFRSGGGLRVFRIEKDQEEVGYGEHPNAQDALAHLELWLQEDNPTYEEFYGGKFPHYLTGNNTPGSCKLDAWLSKGGTLDSFKVGKSVVVELHEWATATPPDEVTVPVVSGEKPYTTWENRGYKFMITPVTFANGARGYRMATTSVPRHKRFSDSTFYKIVKRGHGSTFWEALESALVAEEVEK